MENPSDKMLGGFRILSRLRTGTGTQGTVYKAVCECDDLPLCPRGTVVALKSMPVAADSERDFQKLKANVETLAALNHPNVVRYLGCFTAQVAFAERHVVVQEYLEGEPLSALLRAASSGLDADAALHIVRGMVAGLAAAAARGIIHRDVKPGNVFICRDGSAKLIDFEVSRRIGATATSSSGNLVGSFDYMAPEFTQTGFSGDEVSDVFSAGVVIHEAFTGMVPYARVDARQPGKSSFDFFGRWTRDDTGAFASDVCRVSYRLERVLMHAKGVVAKAVAPNRENRYQTFAELGEALAGVRFREIVDGDRRYQVLRLVGKGGFGEVFKARIDGRTVAVKHLLKLDYAARFFREAKIMSELRDPCFVQFLGFFTVDNPGAKEAFIVMDYLPGMPGSSLRDAINRSAGSGIGFDEAMVAFGRYAHGLGVLHARGIYHRDVKPSNLYLPDGQPEASSIMDLGIARDENGTRTTGQVPGTLDYMPPEVVLGGSRGDAGMDIYALGLCLYEAITGKKGFPRLPSGYAAFAEFSKRARAKSRPTFDDDRVTSRPHLLRLLERMTDPDCERRLSSALEVEAALKRLAAGLAPEEKEEDLATEDARTCETVFVTRQTMTKQLQRQVPAPAEKRRSGEKAKAAARPAKATSRPARRHPIQWRPVVTGALFVALLTVLASCGYFFGAPVCDWFARFLAGEAAAPAKTEKAAIAKDAGLDVENLYGDDSIPLAEADELRDRWLAERRPPVVSREEYARFESLLEKKREERLIRDRLNAARSQFDIDARAVVAAYQAEGVEAGDRLRDDWLRTWGGSAKGRVEQMTATFDAARRERQELDEARARVPKATEAAAWVARSYSIDTLGEADQNADSWRKDWQGRLPPADARQLENLIVTARQKAADKLAAERKAKEGQAVLDGCRSLLDMVTPVESRLNRLNEAETLLLNAVAEGVVDEAAAAQMGGEINARRNWIVFEVENRSNLDLDIGGETLKTGDARLFMFTNGVPENLEANHSGYEPFAFGVHSNGRRIRLLPEHFPLLRVAVQTGRIEKGVICRVDGILAREGTIRLMPGSHECIYYRPDYLAQSLPFRVEPGVPCALPRPYGWKETEALAALVSAEVAAESGDLNLAESLLASAAVQGDDARERKRGLTERITRQRRFLRRVDAAASAYMDAHWMEVVDAYSVLADDGYALTDEDRARVKTAAGNARVGLEMKRRGAADGAAAAKFDAEIAQLDARAKALLETAGQGKGR